MAACPLFFLSFSVIFLLLPHTTTTATETSCNRTSCGTAWNVPSIHSPFYLKYNQSQTCGYQGFELFCNNKDMKQTLISLPKAGTFVVNNISYADQKLWINDPDDCLPKRFLQHRNLDLTVSPFQSLPITVNVTFFNCSTKEFHAFNFLEPIPCLSGGGDGEYSVVAMAPELKYIFPASWNDVLGCQVISSALVPLELDDEFGIFMTKQLYSDIELQWIIPVSPNCDSSKPKKGLGLSLGIAAGAGVIFMMVHLCMLCCAKVIVNREVPREAARMEPNNQQQPSVAAAAATAMEDDEVDTERYPKTKIEDDEGLELSSSSDNGNVCTICLCKYQPKEILRTIPDCKHYFHAHCIDGWLKINASCPLCRKLPKSSTFLASSLSLSSFSLE